MLYELNAQIAENRPAWPDRVIAPEDATDEELMARIQQREEAALAKLMKRYTPMLRSVVGNMIANDQDVTDVLEEAFLGVWNHSESFDSTKGKAIGWILTMARRRAIDKVRP